MPSTSLERGLKVIHSRLVYLYEKYPPSDYVWAVYYSGGKDSTCLLLNIKMFAEKKGFIPIIVHNDTGVELPALAKLTRKVLSTAKEWGFDVKVFKHNKGFFNLMLEKGYSFPVWYKRWCCRTLKYGLTRSWERDNNVLALLALRGDETRRLRSRNFINRDKYRVTAFPLIDVNKEWVWDFLERYCPWIAELKSLYPKGVERLGCWVCTVISEDKALKLLDPELYEMKVALVRARCMSIELFLELLKRFKRKRPDAFEDYDPGLLKEVKLPSCKGKACSKCRLVVWKNKKLCLF